MSSVISKLQNLVAHEDCSSVELPPTEISSRFVELPEKRWQQIWARISQSANPIVVKEARQALNSKQFIICFSLTLIAVFLWTVTAVVIQLPSLYYVPGGMTMLMGFIFILTFPLILVIPYSAFRSMIIESEERTFELVSISALSAQQIVNGKMLSALLQTVIYLSTLTPCFVITYLLRGVQLSSIIYFLTFTLLLSVTATALAILIATIGRAKLLQVLASIGVLAGLLILSIFWSFMTVNTLTFWDMAGWDLQVILGLTMLAGTLLPVCLRAAAAAIDFPSENHATALRIRLTVFIFNCLGWGIWISICSESDEACVSFIIGGLIVFLAIGAFVVSENGIISPRAQRTLPQTMLGRVFGTWYFPGAGLGYILMTCLFTAYVITYGVLALTARGFQISINHGDDLVTICFVSWLYFMFFTGLTRLILLMVSRTVSGRMVIGFLIQAISVLAGMAIPYLLVTMATGFQYPDYGWHQFTNIAWTMDELTARGITAVLPAIIVLALFALPIFGLNLFLCGRDVLLVRIHLPGRIQKETQAPIPDPFA